LHVDYRMMMRADDASATNGASIYRVQREDHRRS